MLVLTRKTGQNIFIGDNIEIIVTKTDYDSVRIAIVAPRDIPISRGELLPNKKAPRASQDTGTFRKRDLTL